MACGRQHYKACGRRHKGQAILPRGLNSLPTRQIDDLHSLSVNPWALFTVITWCSVVRQRMAATTRGCGNGWLRHRHSPRAAATRGCDDGW